MYLEKQTEELWWNPYLVWTEALRHSYAYKFHHCLLIQHHPDVQTQALLETESPHPLWEKLC